MPEAISFDSLEEGRKLPAGDIIVIQCKRGVPGKTKFILKTRPGQWWKQAKLVTGNRSHIARAEAENDQEVEFEVESHQLHDAYLEFWKGMLFGVKTHVYDLTGLYNTAEGMIVKLYWNQD